MSPLDTYRAKRNAARTPEPVPAKEKAPTKSRSGKKPAPTFVIQEHHASRLHWDFRLEKDGVLVSWAVPKGIPVDPKVNRLAVHVEDHPLEYAGFEGTIPKGEYGGGKVTLWDRGTYEVEKWSDREVMVVLHGKRAHGRYVLFQTKGDQWMMHRMDPAPDDWEKMPELVKPMLASPGTMPTDSDRWAFEFKWDGARVVAYIDGGRVRLMSRNDLDVTVTYPELHPLGLDLGSRPAILDGEVIALDEKGVPSFGVLQQRMHVNVAEKARQLAARVPVVYMVFDVLYLDGHSVIDRPYEHRRTLLEGLRLDGPSWKTPPSLRGDGEDFLEAARSRGLEGVIAKRRDSVYTPGRRSPHWIKVKVIRAQGVVIGGWTPGTGRREHRIGALLLGIPDSDGLAYVGKVGTGFTDVMLDALAAKLKPLTTSAPPFTSPPPKADASVATWVRPKLVGEVEFSEWTSTGRLRHPTWRGLRPDKAPSEVVRES